MPTPKTPGNLQIWIDARRQFHLTDAQIQMAKELGLNPKKFGHLGNSKQEKWKRPLTEFIEYLYFKRFGKTEPDRVLSIEEKAKGSERSR